MIISMNNFKVGFIGAGKVGMTLGAYFKSKGFQVIGYASKSEQSAQTAAKITSSQVFSNIGTLVDMCDMIFITTPDDQIGKVWEILKEYKLNDKIICHTSGSLSSAVFEEIETLKANGYSVHPMYAFSEKSGNISGLEAAYFTIEGNNKRIDEVKEFISALGNKSIVIDQNNKTLYHLGNVMVSNLVLSLLEIGDDCLQKSGVDAEIAMQALLPLITANIQNIAKKGFVSSLTGPIERNDIGIIRKHLTVIPKEYCSIYAELSIKLIEIAKRKHPERDYTEISKLMKDYLENLHRTEEK